MDLEKCRDLDEVMELFENEEKKEYIRDLKLIEHFHKRGICHFILDYLIERCSQYEEKNNIYNDYY